MATFTSMVMGIILVVITFGILWFVCVVFEIVMKNYIKNYNETKEKAIRQKLHDIAEREIEKHKKEGTWSL